MPADPAVVLLSGGLDSATTLAIAQAAGFAPHALSFRYGQRHALELDAAAARGEGTRRRGARDRGHRPAACSAARRSPPTSPSPRTAPRPRWRRNPGHLRPGPQHHLPVVRARPGRRCWARRTSSSASTRSTTAAIPTAARSTSRPSSRWPTWPPRRASRARQRSAIHTPLIDLTKAQIIRRGLELGVDYGLTHSCYDPDADGARLRALRLLPAAAQGLSRTRPGSRSRPAYQAVA